MDAMILAAGLGTRLGDITRHMPKALVDVGGGVTPLDHVARRLLEAGADRLIINVHHHADRIVEHVAARGGWGVDVVISREDDAPLETGGGVLHAAPLFRGDGPFLLHNADVITAVDLRALYAAHVASGALATLAVHERSTSRYLLFEDGRLAGRAHADDAVQPGRLRRAFAGIHVVEPRLFGLLEERGAFSIMDAYLRLAAAGHPIAGHDVTGATWLEVGTPERLEAARRALRYDGASRQGDRG
jgi:N-acetyl-alpha-D-muramate 1-phosphate uridylyltransferase